MFCIGLPPFLGGRAGQRKLKKVLQSGKHNLKCSLGGPLGGIWVELGSQVAKLCRKIEKSSKKCSHFEVILGQLGNLLAFFL